jgi:hypothetical protein
MRVKVLRAFFIRGERQELGTEIEVDDAFGREMISVQKAEPVSPIAAPVGPMTTESASGIVAGRKRKGA